MFMKEGFVIKLQKKAGSTELSTKKRREIFFTKRGDRLIEKICKKTRRKKKQEIFIRRDRRAFD